MNEGLICMNVCVEMACFLTSRAATICKMKDAHRVKTRKEDYKKEKKKRQKEDINKHYFLINIIDLEVL